MSPHAHAATTAKPGETTATQPRAARTYSDGYRAGYAQARRDAIWETYADNIRMPNGSTWREWCERFHAEGETHIERGRD